MSSIRIRVSSASGAGPPNIPLCAGALRVRIDTYASTAPRRPVVKVGSPSRTLPMSATTIAAAEPNQSSRVVTYSSKAPPHSSSPSMMIRKPTGGLPSNARRVAACSTTPDLSSAAPRPYSRPPRSVGSNGGEVQAARSPAGCTS